MGAPNPQQQEAMNLTDLGELRRRLFRAPLRTAVIAATVCALFVAWNLATAPSYSATSKLRVADVTERSPQLEARSIPTGTTTEGEAMSILRSRSLVAEVIQPAASDRGPSPSESSGPGLPVRLGLTTWVTDENAPPLRRMARGLIAPVHTGFGIDVQARRLREDAPRAVRLRFLSPSEISLSSVGNGPGIEGRGDLTQRLAYVPGEPLEYRGLTISIENLRGKPDGRSWKIETLSEDEAIDRVLSRVRIHKGQHQPGTLELVCADEDPRRAAAVAGALAQAFIDRDLAATRARAEQKVSYLEAELKSRRASLDSLEAERAERLMASPDIVSSEATTAELAEREGIWDDLFRRTRTQRIAAEKALFSMQGGRSVRAALSGFTAPIPAEVSALLTTLGEEETRLRSVERGSTDTGYRRTLLLKADDYTLEAQRFDVLRADLRDIITELEQGNDDPISRLGGDLAREGSIAVDQSVRLWLAGFEKARAEAGALSAEFKEGYAPLELAESQMRDYRSRIVGGLRSQLAGLDKSAAAKKRNAAFWRELFDSYPESEARLIRSSITQINAEILDVFEAFTRGLKSKEEAASREHIRLRTRIQSIALAERELARSAPERAEMGRVVGELLRDVENARIAAAGVESSVQLIDAPRVPSRRFKPSTSFGLVAGLMLGAIVALLWAWLHGDPMGHGSQRTPAIAALDSMLLGRVAVTGPREGPPRTLKLMRDGAGAATLWLPLMEDPESPGAQLFRALRARVRRLEGRDGGPLKTLGLVSEESGVGTSTVAVNLAMARAQLGERVLLVDGNLSAPSLRKAIDAAGLEDMADLGEGLWESFAGQSLGFGSRPTAGLAECLDGTAHWSDAARPSGFPTLDFLDAGSSAVVSGDLLASDMFTLFCKEVSRVYDSIIIDLPAIHARPDAEGAAPALDGIVVVTHDGDPAATQGIHRLEAAGGHVTGTVIAGKIERRRSHLANGRRAA